ncbi:MAG: UDP-2,3-diacylglucosamine diphosphatase LpxI [Paracoccus sp. (in: a-proteobacteria)]|uniref:LpxI family protein n=1 Tax=Paracoccus sp. TaxID=267 RepID=UPI0026DEEE15|nr:UDP-2,3-diacylglucosamine diphosphatase LpxI [Paracoccus sp. (in: a-proteobacteria)]MDO5612134.1 UDP-2,3-diacylglucosamine diphosphatase LpxI [Paracoccus sp. (in: a-proteobacteria)]
MSDIAIIAGQGGLAPDLAARLPGAPVYTLEGFAPPIPATPFRLERLVPFLDHLSDTGITRVIFAGAVQRPRLDPEMFDPRTAQLVPRMLMAMQSGDDAALRALLDIFEESGLTICTLPDIAPDLVPGPGLLCGQPAPQDKADAERAAAILKTTGPLDIGQGCVVTGGLCLAIETLPGTQAMLEFAARHQALRKTPRGGVLYKAPKPGQDRRIDLPTIGPDTVDQAAAAGLSGIAWEPSGVIVLNRDETIRRADAQGLFLWARAE